MQEATVAEQTDKIFTDVREVEITRAIANEFHDVLIDRAESDVIIIGAGPAGMATLGLLLDNGVKTSDVLWVDPLFEVGDFGETTLS